MVAYVMRAWSVEHRAQSREKGKGKREKGAGSTEEPHIQRHNGLRLPAMPPAGVTGAGCWVLDENQASDGLLPVTLRLSTGGEKVQEQGVSLSAGWHLND